jgi:hypothetical protein
MEKQSDEQFKAMVAIEAAKEEHTLYPSHGPRLNPDI